MTTKEEQPTPAEEEVEEERPEEERHHTVAELAAASHYGRQHISRLLKEGKIKGVKPTGGGWRIPHDEYKRVLEHGLLMAPREKRAVTVIEVPEDKRQKVAPEPANPPEPVKKPISWFDSLYE